MIMNRDCRFILMTYNPLIRRIWKSIFGSFISMSRWIIRPLVEIGPIKQKNVTTGDKRHLYRNNALYFPLVLNQTFRSTVKLCWWLGWIKKCIWKLFWETPFGFYFCSGVLVILFGVLQFGHITRMKLILLFLSVLIDFNRLLHFHLFFGIYSRIKLYRLHFSLDGFVILTWKINNKLKIRNDTSNKRYIKRCQCMHVI